MVWCAQKLSDAFVAPGKAPRRAGARLLLLAGLLVTGRLSGQVVFVTEDYYGYVYQISATGTASTYPVTAYSFGIPEGLAFDSSGNLYVGNTSNHTVSKVTPGGSVSTFATVGNGAGGALAFDSGGNLFVASNGGAISKVTPDGAVTTFASGFSEVIALAFAQNGNLYATDFTGTNSTLDQITPGGVVSSFASILGAASGLAIDGAGNLYVSSTTQGDIYKVSPGGVVTTFLSDLTHPRGLSYDPSSGLLFFTQGFSNSFGASVYDTSLSGQVSFVAGSITDGNYTAVMLAAVPEPDTCSMMILGLGALGLVAVRHRRRTGRGESSRGILPA